MNKYAMQLLVESHRIAQKTDDKLREIGYGDTPYGEIAGRIADAIYYMLGEHTGTFTESVTCNTLSSRMSAEKKAQILMEKYKSVNNA